MQMRHHNSWWSSEEDGSDRDDVLAVSICCASILLTSTSWSQGWPPARRQWHDMLKRHCPLLPSKKQRIEGSMWCHLWLVAQGFSSCSSYCHAFWEEASLASVPGKIAIAYEQNGFHQQALFWNLAGAWSVVTKLKIYAYVILSLVTW